ncbi:hypothetical protein FSP39_002454 [Pinctada imbricata]|uniref:BTB domain-containing protein n=1 Tax=Pinctada imbricata TaxID=66713 RepID=A0AA89BK32_PINIB|nr:hypothetical protein FSP39_002454 [Pinctada imbricata]
MMASVVKDKIKKKTTNYKEIHVNRRKWKEKAGSVGVTGSGSTKSVLRLSETVLQGFEVLWRQNILCDVVILSAGRSFHVHKILLVACSDFFYDLFVENMHQSREVDLSHVCGEVLGVIIQCMYTGKIYVTSESVEEIMTTASGLGFYIVLEACEEFLIERTNPRSCLRMVARAFKFRLRRLGDKALQLCAQYFPAVRRRPQFKELPVDQLLELIQRDDLDVESELEVFQSILDWLEHRQDERLLDAPQLMGAVRLPLLSPSVIIDSVESVGYLMDVGECQDLVKEALHYHCVPARQAVLQSTRTTPRNKIRIQRMFSIGGAPRLKYEVVNDGVRMLDDDEGSWETLSHLPEPRHHHAVAVLGGFLYTWRAGRRKMTTVRLLLTYSGLTLIVRRGYTVASMISRRQSFQMAVLNNCIYAVGGRVDRNESLASVERYSPQWDMWEELTPLSSPKRCVAVAALNGKIFAVGGSGNGVISSKVECYIPSINTWEMRKPIRTPRFFAHLVPVSGSLLLVGGATIHNDGELKCVAEIEKYNPGTDTWVTITNMKTPRSEFGCCLLNNKVYVAGGYSWDTSERLKSVQCLNLDSLIWSNLAELDAPWTGSCCVTLTLFTNKAFERSHRRTKSSPHLPLTT